MLDQLQDEQHLLKSMSLGNRNAFWHLWSKHQDYLYSCCLTWMGGNQEDAVEAFSQATLRAREQLPKYASKITNPKIWLTQLTHKLCIDLRRENKQKVSQDK